EDVSWALRTASSLWTTGACEDALRWLRRAAEAANDVDDDERALELFKAAATLASSMPAPTAPAPDTWRPPPDTPTPPSARARPSSRPAPSARAQPSPVPPSRTRPPPLPRNPTPSNGVPGLAPPSQPRAGLPALAAPTPAAFSVESLLAAARP